ncbi:hypothetical protein EYF80_048754 [Liparis tanakae]|uniref:Uncharacterized protein n=1 Tax=Liparis tanakae TaxID=230148 RepID=A0A4Z2FJI7_9TELE|nr:hypothetical protein EYF80_048754 [Liparis tanakae]
MLANVLIRFDLHAMNFFLGEVVEALQQQRHAVLNVGQLLQDVEVGPPKVFRGLFHRRGVLNQEQTLVRQVGHEIQYLLGIAPPSDGTFRALAFWASCHSGGDSSNNRLVVIGATRVVFLSIGIARTFPCAWRAAGLHFSIRSPCHTSIVQCVRHDLFVFTQLY